MTFAAATVRRSQGVVVWASVTVYILAIDAIFKICQT